MAVKTYLYRRSGVTDADLVPFLAGGAGAVVGVTVNDANTAITVDEAHKDDLDDAMASFGYLFVREYIDPAPIVARTDFGVLAADPVGSTPGAGDYYFNTSLQLEMRYDSLRAKWLSDETVTFLFGRNNNTAVDQYYRAGDDRVMSASEGLLAVRSGTVVSLGWTRTDSDAATFDIVANGGSLGTVASAATSGRDITLNLDFTFNQILAVRNTGANPTSNVTAWLRLKWRV